MDQYFVRFATSSGNLDMPVAANLTFDEVKSIFIGKIKPKKQPEGWKEPVLWVEHENGEQEEIQFDTPAE